MRQDFIVGLDLGTAKAFAVIAARNEEERLEVLGAATIPSAGLRNGVIINIAAAVEVVQELVSQVCLAAQIPTEDVVLVNVAVAGGVVEGLNSRGVVAISNQQEIRQEDVDRVLDAAKAVLIPMDRKLLHFIAQEYTVDDVRKIKDPLSMIGIRLEAEVHLITGSVSACKNLTQCVNRAGIGVDEVILEPLASAQAVLSEEEKEVGALLIDMGAGTTGYILYLEGTPHFTRVQALGGNRITKDLAQVMQIPEDEAERIKLRDGAAYLKVLDYESEVIVKGVGSRPAAVVPRSQVCEILQPRAEEILQQICEELKQQNYLHRIGGGIVLTGGAAKLPGLVELAEDIFRKPVRIGVPALLPGMPERFREPEYACGLGLILWADSQMEKVPTGTGGARKKPRGEGFLGRLKNALGKYWV